MTDAPHHDSAAFLEVVSLDGASGSPDAGWYVWRTCPCHRHTVVSIAFPTRAEAERCRDVLDDDYRQRLARGGYG